MLRGTFVAAGERLLVTLTVHPGPPPPHHAPQAGPDLARPAARIALVGRRAAGVLARTRYAPMLEALWRCELLLLNAYRVSTARLDGPRDLAGFDRIGLVPGSPYRSEEAFGARTTVERYQCTYAPDPRCAGTLRDYGWRFTGQDDGRPRIAELPGHRFFPSTLS
ncbi:hypothetical protein ACIQVN_15190 [Streptomyces cyaneofuscatus]|uniref:hypothetical protein n=1 Tax=Streptomyces cyaneofuscatus TaxID=66883 RepID=UPI003814101D